LASFLVLLKEPGILQIEMHHYHPTKLIKVRRDLTSQPKVESLIRIACFSRRTALEHHTTLCRRPFRRILSTMLLAPLIM
jgi:hypothetical protein